MSAKQLVWFHLSTVIALGFTSMVFAAYSRGLQIQISLALYPCNFPPCCPCVSGKLIKEQIMPLKAPRLLSKSSSNLMKEDVNCPGSQSLILNIWLPFFSISDHSISSCVSVWAFPTAAGEEMTQTTCRTLSKVQQQTKKRSDLSKRQF